VYKKTGGQVKLQSGWTSEILLRETPAGDFTIRRIKMKKTAKYGRFWKGPVYMAGCACLLLSCATYGIGGGYTRRTQEPETPSGTKTNLTDESFSLYLNGSTAYFESLIGFHRGTVKAEGGGVDETMDVSGVSLGSYFKLPFVINQFLTPVV
jgi:hypothetical protein